MHFQTILDDINAQIRPELGLTGKVANYIPALARVSPLQFGMALRTCDGVEAATGDHATPFSIQSVSKVFSLTLAKQRHARSGVGGGIVAVVPDTLTLCVWSPALDPTGNSHLGRKALELFVARTGLSVF